jgi:hypothetical protein
MKIEEWKPDPKSSRLPPPKPVSKWRAVLVNTLIFTGAFLVCLAVFGRHEISEYIAQRSAKDERPSVPATPAWPTPGQTVAHAVAAQDLRQLPPTQVAVNSVQPEHFGPRPLPKEKPVIVPLPREPEHPKPYQ